MDEWGRGMDSLAPLLFTLKTKDFFMPKGLPKSIGHRSGGCEPRLKEYTVATVPSVSDYPMGVLIFVSNGAAGSPVVAFNDGTNWARVDTLAAVAAV